MIILTLLTQTGGIILLLAYIIWKIANWDLAFLRLGSFFVLYLGINLLAVPFLAERFDKQPLPLFHHQIGPQNWLLVLANRHYVHKDLYAVIMEVAEKYHDKQPDRKLIYLDAGFPLGKFFPLPPHRAHVDGKAIDFAFAYTDDRTEQPTRRAPNWLAYGRFEGPERREPNFPEDCRAEGNWYYSLPQFLALRKFEHISVDNQACRQQVRFFARHRAVKHIFIEPHLKQRWRLMGQSKIRFHGCKAMRHDDHYHVALK